jgi:hypothetical protein
MSWREIWRDLWFKAVIGLVLATEILLPSLSILWGISARNPSRPVRPPVPGREKAAAEMLELGRATADEVIAYHSALDSLLTDDLGRRVAADPDLVKRYRTLRGEDRRAERQYVGETSFRSDELQGWSNPDSATRVTKSGEVLTPDDELHRMTVRLVGIRARYSPLRRELDDIQAEAGRAATAGRFTLKEALGYLY